MIFRLFGVNCVDFFEGIKIYESAHLGYGFDSKGLCLPGLGIFVGDGTHTKAQDIGVLRHEYGHILQTKEIGYLAFYICVGLPSLLSAWTNGWGRGHQNYWTEGWANDLASRYFHSVNWPHHRFPVKSISKKTLIKIKWGI